MIFLQSKKSNKKTSKLSLAIPTGLNLIENKGEDFSPQGKHVLEIMKKD